MHIRVDAVHTMNGHGRIKGMHVTWMRDTGWRQVDLGASRRSLDQSTGIVMPFWTDNGILFLGVWDYPDF